MPVVFKTSKIAQRAQSDPLLYEILRDLGRAITDRIKGTPGVVPVWDTASTIADSPLSVDGRDLVFAGGVKGSLTKALAESVATPFVDVSLLAGQYVAGECLWAVEAKDAVELQCRTGRLRFVAVNKAGTVTASVNEVGSPEVVLTSAATLTVTNTVTAGASKITLNCNAVSGLTETGLQLRYRMDVLHGAAVITPV